MENNINMENKEMEVEEVKENVHPILTVFKAFKGKIIKAYLIIGAVIFFTGNDLEYLTDMGTDVSEVLFTAIIDIVFWLPLTIANLVNGVIQ